MDLLNIGYEQFRRTRIKDTSEVLSLGHSMSGSKEYNVEVISLHVENCFK